MKIKILTHAQCFDGAASAALFSEFYRSQVNHDAEFSYQGLSYKKGPIYTEDVFSSDADVHVVVDLKYSSDDRFEWWFDHHSDGAFDSREEEQRFRSNESGKHFYDPGYKSCTKLIADVTAEKFDFNTGGWADLIAHADRIDGATYASLEEACDFTSPAAILHAVIEHHNCPDLFARIIRLMRIGPLTEAAGDPNVAEAFQPVLAAHEASLAAIRDHARVEKGVISFDLSETGIEKYHKFAPFVVAPATYNLSVTRQKGQYKLSLGFNKFCGLEKSPQNLGSMCAPYGGGGHEGIGAARFDDVKAARRAMNEILEKLTA